MPYCPKCGVEVDYDISKCPLCQYDIPKIKGEIAVDSNRFPLAVNNHPEKIHRLKSRIFHVISILLVSTVLLTLFLDYNIAGTFTWSKYASISILAVLLYTYFCFGFISVFRKNFVGVGITTLALIFFIDLFSNGLSWFVPLGAPITLSLLIITVFVITISKSFQRKGCNVVSLTLIGISVYCVIIELCISNYFWGYIKLHWSLLVLIQLIPLSLLLLYFHYGLSKKYGDWIKRFFHI